MPEMKLKIASCTFQEHIAGNLCFGCGPGNPHGLQIKNQWDGADSVCTHQPQPHQAAGPAHIVNGGIIATLIECTMTSDGTPCATADVIAVRVPNSWTEPA